MRRAVVIIIDMIVAEEMTVASATGAERRGCGGRHFGKELGIRIILLELLKWQMSTYLNLINDD
jgi:hypothetical protein